MAISSFQRRLQPTGPTLPQEAAAALDASAEDLRHDRVEDAATFLKRVQAKVDAYEAGRTAAPRFSGKR